MQRRSPLILAAPMAALAVAQASAAQAAGPVAFDDPRLQAPASLVVSVPAVASGDALPANYTADGRNISPPLSWTAGPAATRSYVIVLQDPDAPGSAAAVHWLLYNVAATVTLLPRAMKNQSEPAKPVGALQGGNFHGSFGYSGPRPPVGDQPHHYHFQVFALDRPLKIAPGAALPAVERAMAGHVIARGERVATYAAPDPHVPSGKTAPVAPPAPQP